MNERGNREGVAAGDAGQSTSSADGSRQLPVACVAAWDPYDVWLKRVKQPRDARASRTPAHAVPADAVPAATTQTAAISASASKLALAPTR